MSSKTCMAEDQCINRYCGKGYDHTATKFPYYVNYTKWEWPGEDVFDFRVSALPHSLRDLLLSTVTALNRVCTVHSEVIQHL